jgi:S-disulfanyl-L-cysteine oxidoreductase SoxD
MRFLWAALLAAFIAALATSLIAQDPPPIWTGVYTSAQAERGAAVYHRHCGECHHDDLSGGEGPALVGNSFMVKWEMSSVERLFHKIRDTMPEVGSSDVTDAQKLDTVAFILQQNGYPAGTTELTDVKNALAAIRMIPRGGAAPPRSGALVQSVGCLKEVPGSGWTLVQGTDPQVTSRDPVSAEEKETLAAAPPGTHSIELLSVYPRPAELIDNTVIVKGLFVSRPAGMRINVTSLELVHLKCGQ